MKYIISENQYRDLVNEVLVYNKETGELVDKILYPFDKIGKFVYWFYEEYGEYALTQGWSIFDSDSDAPNEKYFSDRKFNDKLVGGYWQVEKLDNPGEGEGIGYVPNDDVADELAKKLGIMVDEYGVVYGYDGQSFLDE